MFTLVTDRSKFYRIKRGQSAGEIERLFNTPAQGRAFAGKIIGVSDKNLAVYSAKVGDTYRTVAAAFGSDENTLRKINSDKPVYPTCKLFVPCR